MLRAGTAAPPGQHCTSVGSAVPGGLELGLELAPGIRGDLLCWLAGLPSPKPSVSLSRTIRASQLQGDAQIG